MQPGHLFGQLSVVAGEGQCELPDMELDVEVGVLDPVRMVEPEGHHDQPATKERNQRQPGLNDLGEVLQGHP